MAGGRAVMSTIESDGDVVGMCDDDDGDEEEEVKDVVVVGN